VSEGIPSRATFAGELEVERLNVKQDKPKIDKYERPLARNSRVL
jgi:hypothetical protein